MKKSVLLCEQQSEDTTIFVFDFLISIPNVSLIDRFVFGAVKRFSNNEIKRCFATNNFLSKFLGISKNSVTNSIMKWEKLGVFIRRSSKVFKNGVIVGKRRCLFLNEEADVLKQAKKEYNQNLAQFYNQEYSYVFNE